MNKKFLIIVVIVLFVVAAGTTWLFLLQEDPVVTQAKEEVRQVRVVLDKFQNTINAIPALELSQDVKNDFKIQSAYLGMVGYVDPARGDSQSPKVIEYALKLTTASNARASSKISFDLDGGLENISKTAVTVADVTGEDLGFLEKLAGTFDEAVKNARNDAPTLPVLTIERNKKTERYFLEFDRMSQQLQAMADSLNSYASADFRAQLKELKSANNIFGEIARYTDGLLYGKAWGYSLNIAGLFPEVKQEEEIVKRCAQLRTTGECQPVGPFPAKYQELLRELEVIYGQLVEE